MAKYLGVKGMNDILPAESYKWLWLESKLREWLESYGYSNLRTPILEQTQLFQRSIGDVTDIVEKEMYSFVDRLNGDNLTLRPEGTAGTVRATLEHNLLYNSSQKIWLIGPMFRHERPQKGRYRQFHQLSVEAIGFKGPNIDAEIIQMLDDLWHRLGLKNIILHINCLGNSIERSLHKNALVKYFSEHYQILDQDSKRRLDSNPLRILDTKNPDLQNLVENAPKLIDFLGEDSLKFYQRWKQLLDDMQIKYVENHRLVRGLDYYNLSVFEWVSSDLGSQSTVCGGGRYDPLFNELSNKENYGIGFGLGIERLLLSLEAMNLIPTPIRPDVYLVGFGDNVETYLFGIAKQLRQQNLNVIQDFSGASLKSQLKKANAVKSKFCIIVGENEVTTQQVVVKSMDNETQITLDYSKFMIYLLGAINETS